MKLKCNGWFGKSFFLAAAAVFIIPACASACDWNRTMPLTSDMGRVIAMDIYNQAFTQKDVNSAIATMEKARGIFPESIVINMSLAKLYLGTGQTQNGIERLEQALEIVPNYPTAQVMLGEQLLRKAQYIEALDHLKPVYQMSSDWRNIGFYTGYAYYNLGNFKKAAECFQANVSDDPQIRELNQKFLQAVSEASRVYKWVAVRDAQSPLWVPLKQ